MTIYTYRLRNRPAMYGTVPDKRRVDLDTADPLPYGTVSYERPLTPREIYRFELVPASPDPVLPLYPAGSTVKDMRNGKLYTVKARNGEYWIRDGIASTIQDWLFFEPVLSDSDNDYLWTEDHDYPPFDMVTYESGAREIEQGDRVTGLYFGEVYTGTVGGIEPGFGYFVDLDDKSLCLGFSKDGIVVSLKGVRNNRVTIRLITQDPIGDYTSADNDYLWQHDTNVYPNDTTIYDLPVVPIEFPAEDNEIVTQYVDGTLQVIVSREMGKRQIRAYIIGAGRIKGIRFCDLDTTAQFSSGYTSFCFTFKPNVARLIEDIRQTVRDYTARFLSELQPETVQVSLFDSGPAQMAMF